MEQARDFHEGWYDDIKNGCSLVIVCWDGDFAYKTGYKKGLGLVIQ